MVQVHTGCEKCSKLQLMNMWRSRLGKRHACPQMRQTISLTGMGTIKFSKKSGGSTVQRSAGAKEEQRKHFSARAIIPCYARFHTLLRRQS